MFPVLKQMSAEHQLGDTEVLRRSLREPWMFGMIVDRYQKVFLRKASYLLHSEDLAQDAVQDTFLKIYRFAEKFSERKGASFSSWAYKILSNTCYTYISKKTEDIKRLKFLEFTDIDASVASTADTKEDLSYVRSVMSRMSLKFSKLLSLYFFEDKSYDEIAASEEMSISAVRSGLHRAKKQFKSIATEIT